MPFCPNPECPYRKRHGEPAEYLQGMTACSDCGSSLSETAPILHPLEKTRKFIVTDFHKKLILTLLLLLFWNLLHHIGAPGINYEELTKLTHGESSRAYSRISLLSLGLMPYVSAYILIEIFALFLPPLKSWRENGYAGRSNLVRAARWLTLVLALIQGYYLAQGLETMAFGQAVYQPGLSFRLLLMITLVAGTFFTVWIADMINSIGIGHGISMLIFAGYVHGLPRRAEMIIRAYDGPNPLKYYLGEILALLALIALIIIVERAHHKIKIMFADGKTAYIPLKLTTAGLVPADWAGSLMMYPATLAGFWGEQYPFLIRLANAITPRNSIYYFGIIILIILFYYLFSFLFHRPKNTLQYLHDQNAHIVDEIFKSDNKNLRYVRNTMAFIGALYLCFFTLLQDISFQISDIPLDGLELIVAMAIGLDLASEVRIRMHSKKLLKIAEFQKPSEAGLLRSLLKQHDIPCQLRGYYYRSLLYFFGPYIEIAAFVPEEKVTEAQDVIAKYLKLT